MQIHIFVAKSDCVHTQELQLSLSLLSRFLYETMVIFCDFGRSLDHFSATKDIIYDFFNLFKNSTHTFLQ